MEKETTFLEIWQNYFNILCCPDCIETNSDLIYTDIGDKEILTCNQCGQEYMIINSVPILLSQKRNPNILKTINTNLDFPKPLVKKDVDLSSVGDWKYLSYQYYSRFQEFKKSLTHFSPQNTVLDIGCAGGSLASIFDHYIGIDISWKLISFARSYLDKPFVLADATNLPFKTKSLSHFISRNMLEHTNNDQVIIREASRVCSANGIFELPCSDGVSFLIDPVNTFRIKIGQPPKPFFSYGFGHINMQTETEWEKRLIKNGFQIKDKRNLGRGIFFKLFSFLEFLFLSYGENDDIPAKYVNKSVFKFLHPIYNLIYKIDVKTQKSWSKVFCVQPLREVVTNENSVN